MPYLSLFHFTMQLLGFSKRSTCLESSVEPRNSAPNGLEASAASVESARAPTPPRRAVDSPRCSLCTGRAEVKISSRP